mgnify:CR=1 FL=1
MTYMIAEHNIEPVAVRPHLSRTNAPRRSVDLTQRDPLTGLLKCDGFMRKFREAFSFRNDMQGPLHADESGLLLLLDIENFHLIQNVYGRSVAQNCLREIGDILGGFVQKYGAKHNIAGRLRNDEFGLLMRDISLDEALQCLHELSARLNDITVKAGTTEIDLSVNIGLKPYRSGDTAEVTLAGADLYKQALTEEDHLMKDDKKNALKPGKKINYSSSLQNRENHAARHAMS